MGAQHTQKTAEDLKNGQPATPNTGGKILFLTIFDRATYSGLFKLTSALNSLECHQRFKRLRDTHPLSLFIDNKVRVKGCRIVSRKVRVTCFS